MISRVYICPHAGLSVVPRQDNTKYVAWFWRCSRHAFLEECDCLHLGRNKRQRPIRKAKQGKGVVAGVASFRVYEDHVSKGCTVVCCHRAVGGEPKVSEITPHRSSTSPIRSRTAIHILLAGRASSTPLRAYACVVPRTKGTSNRIQRNYA